MTVLAELARVIPRTLQLASGTCHPANAARPQEIAVAAANWFRSIYLAHFSRPKGNRQLYRLIKREEISRIVEIGISDIARTVAMIELAQGATSEGKVCYTGIDFFEARPKSKPSLSLKDAYRVLRATGAAVRLVPGAPGASLASAANAHQNTDLILIAPDVTEADLAGAWFFVPRMLHAETVMFNEGRDANGQPTFARLTRSQVAEWAGRDSARRAA
jgi:hypothetical protein